MSNALDYCGIKLYVHFLDLYQAHPGTNFPDGWEARLEYHEKADKFEDELHTIEGVTETCMSHQCWLAIEPDSDDLLPVAEATRKRIAELLDEIFGKGT